MKSLSIVVILVCTFSSVVLLIMDSTNWMLLTNSIPLGYFLRELLI